MKKQKRHSVLTVIEFKHGGSFLFKFTSKNKIQLSDILNCLPHVSDWNKDTDYITTIDSTVETINMDKVKK